MWQNDAMWDKFLAELNRLTSSTWALPMGSAGLLLLAILLEIPVAILAGWLDEASAILMPVAWVIFALFLLGVFGGLSVLVWLPAMSIRWWKRREIKRILLCWVWSGVAAVVAVLLGHWEMYQAFGGGSDYFTVGVSIPEDKEFVIPDGMSFFINEDVPEQVEKLRNLHPFLPEVKEETAELSAPNLAKLSREAPDLLQEYLMRCLYAQATNLRFSSRVHGSVFPAHMADAQTYIYSSDNHYDVHELLPLHNGWSVKVQVEWPDEWRGQPQKYAAEVRALDDELAPLAQNPTREQLDSMLPPVPEQPYLGLREYDAGVYDMFIVIPKDYTEGKFELSANEYSCNKKIRFENFWQPEMTVGNTCRMIRSKGLNVVYSGDYGEYYGSVWEIWFTPADGGEARCVNRQLFLMVGWQR